MPRRGVPVPHAAYEFRPPAAQRAAPPRGSARVVAMWEVG
eukprot:gene5527-5593_t